MKVRDIINALEQNIKNKENVIFSRKQLKKWDIIIKKNPDLNILNWRVT